MKKIDFAVIFILLSLCLAALIIHHAAFSNAGSYVVVTIDGNEYTRLPLSSDCNFDIPSGSGYNSLTISAGTAYITAASCPDKICVNHKAVSNVGETIICLPNKVIIEIITD